MRLKARELRRTIGEAVIDFQKFKNEKNVKAYEVVIGRFLAAANTGVDKLQFAKEFMSPEETKLFDEFLSSYRHALSSLSAFLRAKRLRMLKQK